MPKVATRDSEVPPINTLASVTHLRVLRTLAAGGALSRAKIGGRAGLSGAADGGVLRELAARGWAAKEEMDIDGVVEVTWEVTDAGRSVLVASPEAGARLPDLGDKSDLKIRSLVPLFGTNRTLAGEVGRELRGCEWVGVPFCGGLSEFGSITARTIVAGDKHRHILNLARVAGHPELGPLLYRQLRRIPFHETALAAAQLACEAREEGEMPEEADLQWAVDYFVCAWMARSGTAGTAKEFNSPLSLRWNAGGGDSPKRFYNAVKGLVDWRRILYRCTFVCLDAFDFLAEAKERDQAKHGIYNDPPFVGVGAGYKHKFGAEEWARLAVTLGEFEHAKVVVRCYDAPLMRGLFPEPRWRWQRFVGKRQTNTNAPEVLVTNNTGE